jgi:hypothetical protein
MGRNRALGTPFEVQTVTASFTTRAHVDMYVVDATLGSPVTANLDPGAFAGDQVIVQDVAQNAGTQPITVSPSPGQVIVGSSGSYSVNTDGGGVLLTYDVDINGWVPQAILALAGTLGPNATSSGPTPGIAPGANAGTGARASIAGTDTAGLITVTVGAGQGAGPQAVVTFATPFTEPPSSVVFSAANLDTGDQIYELYVDTVTATGFVLEAVGSFGGNIAVYYIVLG